MVCSDFWGLRLEKQIEERESGRVLWNCVNGVLGIDSWDVEEMDKAMAFFFFF